MADAPNAPASTTAPADEPVTAEQQKALQRAVKNNLTRQIVMMLASCINCGMCAVVCPHGVFAIGNGAGVAQLVRWEACMECGACQLNCPTGAIVVDSGVGCASAMIAAALTGKEPTCGSDTDESCCCS